MAKYYIDYENVHNEGLKGVQKLQQGDKLHLFYSIKADTLKIDVVRQLMECPATICFDKIINGVENALDFQLITALMCNYNDEENYYIISRDKGYDAAIEMACKQNRCNIYRCKDIDGALKHQDGLGIDESDQEVIVDLGDLSSDYKAEDGFQPEPAAEFQPENEEEAAVFSQDSQEQMEDMPAESAPEALELVAEDIQEPKQEAEIQVSIPFSAEEKAEPIVQQDNDCSEIQDSEENTENQETNPVEIAGLTEDEIKRRAHQSICTKLLNYIKLNQKIPLVYKQAEEICEALEDSETKMQFYHRLLQSLGRKKGGELYQKVKAIYKSIRAIYQSSLAGEEQSEDNKPQISVETPQQGDSMIVRTPRTPRITAKNPRGRRRTRQDDGEMAAQQVESGQNSFGQASKQQSNEGALN